jgi:transcriptional regulator with XRE-family HTH domain
MAKMADMKLYEKLNRAIALRDMSQNQVAVRLRRSFPHIRNAGKSVVYTWFDGSQIPRVDAAVALAKILEVPVAYLLDDDIDALPTELEQKVFELICALGPEEAYARLLGMQGAKKPQNTDPWGVLGPKKLPDRTINPPKPGKKPKGKPGGMGPTSADSANHLHKRPASDGRKSRP